MSNIATLRDDWEYLANEDAFHAILTDENKAHGRWDVDEFMATGTAEVETVMEHLSRLGIVLDWTGSALDFGCGVGAVDPGAWAVLRILRGRGYSEGDD